MRAMVGVLLVPYVVGFVVGMVVGWAGAVVVSLVESDRRATREWTESANGRDWLARAEQRPGYWNEQFIRQRKSVG